MDWKKVFAGVALVLLAMPTVAMAHRHHRQASRPVNIGPALNQTVRVVQMHQNLPAQIVWSDTTLAIKGSVAFASSGCLWDLVANQEICFSSYFKSNEKEIHVSVYIYTEDGSLIEDRDVVIPPRVSSDLSGGGGSGGAGGGRINMK
jgi:hypothetical protein